MILRTLRITLAIILAIYSIPAILSGLDIFKGTEPDLSTEWIIVCIYFVLVLVLIISNLLELIRKAKA